ncbi:FeoB-associated Cys-rich membrane protein [Anaerococcus vaginimassiliensis]|uniref:FeoB-associated Cys-rich membrane protein n=1 Tax=Anaerococcus vaginimassiliensis TaxID=2042308 RepID=UPI0010307171|nr:FeoB-associated Cys-rich membrane protein [Anaerococcus vaginimassiliensis]
MNLQSIIVLVVIVAACAYVIYTRFIAEDSHGGCKDCAACASGKSNSKSKSCGCGS